MSHFDDFRICWYSSLSVELSMVETTSPNPSKTDPQVVIILFHVHTAHGVAHTALGTAMAGYDLRCPGRDLAILGEQESPRTIPC